MPLDEHKCTMEDKHLVSRSAPREHHKFFDVPVTNGRKVHLNNLEASTSRASLHGRSFIRIHVMREQGVFPQESMLLLPVMQVQEIMGVVQGQHLRGWMI